MKVVISAPCVVQDTTCKLNVNVILVAKFMFRAENNHEISVNKGDVLKLLDRPGNGWLLVKFIDKLEKPGLVPATYVEIVLNDSVSPVTVQWLQETSDLSRSGSLQVSPPSFGRPPRLQSVQILHCLLHNERYWYRLDAQYSDNSGRFLCKYYSDFYELHALLQEHFTVLPKLPQPVQFISSQDMVSNLKKRCKDLDNYVNELFQNEAIVTSGIVSDWLDISKQGNIGFFVEDLSRFNLTSYEISQNVQPNSSEIDR
ncbi:hypothetical protein CAAN1_11S04918 [[Candida] anglica]|uniref:PX domain-containing protein n=1 Tax=[Candida] anglica TaxID=148631 RepID=A0ABP0EM23_9ASCO